jgi:hypothetical protein
MADLSNLARQAEERPGLIASRLATYQQAKQLDDADLATQLDCTVDNLIHLRLCSLPRPDHFDEDVQSIAEYAHADPAALAQILGGQQHTETL